MMKRFFALLIAAALCFSCASALTRDQLRSAYALMVSRRNAASPYQEMPDIKTFATSGALTSQAQYEALDYLNFIRMLAGLEPVSLSPLYVFRSQNGAVLLAANDQISHHPEIAEGMPQMLYESALLGTSLGNIAKFNWMRPEILLDGVEYFVRDDGDYNLPDLGHRRWMLNPCMQETGFGLANAKSGMSYVTMYAVDNGNADAQWDRVCWPCDGAFPVELMRSNLAWSISLNDEIYDLSASSPTVSLTEERSGAVYRFDYTARSGDGFCLYNTAAYGSGSCLIFRPNLGEKGLGEYLQNQRWRVEVKGLVKQDGQSGDFSYLCEMASLNPQDVANVEISQLNAQLRMGETLQLSAQVIPSYADDLSLSYASDNPAVACVDASGLVTAIAPGSCRVTVSTVNNRTDSCEITVY